jgi:hypothetical protein
LRAAKRYRRTYTRASYRLKMRTRCARSRFRPKSKKFSRWNKNKRSIPNVRVRPFRFFHFPVAVAVKPGAALEDQYLTDIPSASRTFNNVLIKSFDIDLQFMPVDGCFRPTWVRFTIVVQTGTYILPNASELIHGVSHLDNFIDMSSGVDILRKESPIIRGVNVSGSFKPSLVDWL